MYQKYSLFEMVDTPVCSLERGRSAGYTPVCSLLEHHKPMSCGEGNEVDGQPCVPYDTILRLLRSE